MTRLKCHHRPRVWRSRNRRDPKWWAHCPACGWVRYGDDWHAAYTFARDHAESSLT